MSTVLVRGHKKGGKSEALRSEDGRLFIYSMMRKAVALAAVTTYDAEDVIGVHITAVGTGNWTFVFKDGGSMTIPAAGLIVGQLYPYHLSSITSPTGGTAVLGLKS